MDSSKFIPIIVDGQDYSVTWQDFGHFRRLNVFQNDKKLGHKDFTLNIDMGEGTVFYVIRKLLRDKQYAKI